MFYIITTGPICSQFCGGVSEPASQFPLILTQSNISPPAGDYCSACCVLCVRGGGGGEEGGGGRRRPHSCG